MRDSSRKWLTTLLVTCCGLAVFLPTIDWGLPSRETDRALFGDRKAWTGKEILELLAERDQSQSASIDGAPNSPPLAGGAGGGVLSVGGDIVLRERLSVSPPPPSPSREGRGVDASLAEGTHASENPHPNPLPQAGEGVRGADVDANPILDRSQPVILNDTDAKRAEIVQRYRLMSQQPDEFIQFKALAEMSQRTGLAKLDPRLYQYGGLWIYPVGALVRTAMLVGYIEQPPVGVSAKEFYLDHPEVFGKFYIVARAYSTMWGIVAALAIACITRRLTSSHLLAFVAAIAFILLPVTRTAAHEAKPHLAGAALCLCAVIAATRYAENGKRRYAILAGALCGAAMAMVVSMLLSLVVLPMMGWVRWRLSRLSALNSPPLAGGAGGGGLSVGGDDDSSERSSVTTPPPSPRDRLRLPHSRKGRGVVFALFVACVSAFLVYALTNPFLLYNAVFHPEILKSNLGNSTAMYGVGGISEAIASAVLIAIAGMTLGGVILALLSIVVLIIASVYGCHRSRYAETCAANDASEHRSASTPTCGTRSVSPVGWILAAPAACVLIQFVLLAAGKPAEYARFGLVAASTLCVLIGSTCSFIHIDRQLKELWRDRSLSDFATGLVVIGFVLVGVMALNSSDERLPLWKRDLQQGNPPTRYGKSFWTLGLSHEPAPWSVMPLNLFRDQLILTKPAADAKSAIYDVYLYPSNLASQVGLSSDGESVDWARNRTGMILGSLPPPTTQAAGTTR